jgi:hypothetical protein
VDATVVGADEAVLRGVEDVAAGGSEAVLGIASSPVGGSCLVTTTYRTDLAMPLSLAALRFKFEFATKLMSVTFFSPLMPITPR